MQQGMRVGALAVAVCAAAGLTGSSPAQDALGSGHLLDANPLANSVGYNSPAPLADYAARNLLITGDVAGGRGFRGTVGYTSSYDFRGATGSDDLYQFRALSALSSPGYILGGSSMEQLRFGQYINEIEYRRASRAASAPAPTGGSTLAAPTFLDDRMAQDRIAYSSMSAAVDTGASDLQVVSLLQSDKGERLLVGASSLLGVQATPMENQGQLIGLSTFDMARARQDAGLGRAGTQVGAQFTTTFKGLPAPRAENTAPAGLLEPRTANDRQDMAIAPAYMGVLTTIAERAAPAKGEVAAPQLEALDRQFEKLREQLAKAKAKAPASSARQQPGKEKDAHTTDEDEEADAPPPINNDLAMVLRHGQRVDHLSTGDTSRFNELMKQAEESLRDGEYFWAERHFDRALRFTPGQPLATAGRGHAQIGAGLYAPAAMTLQRMIIEHPEMIDVTYAPELLPSKARLLMAVGKVRELIAQVDRDRSLHAFLLAYIGRQLGDRAMIDEGLASMEPGNLRDLLTQVWAPAGPP